MVSFLETQHKDPGQGVSVLEPRELMTILPLHLQLKGILAYLHTCILAYLHTCILAYFLLKKRKKKNIHLSVLKGKRIHYDILMIKPSKSSL